MPTPSLRRKHSRAAASNRWNTKKLHEKQESSDQDEEFDVSMDEAETVDDDAVSDTDLLSKLDVATIGDVFELCKEQCGSRKLSVLLYMILRHLGHPWRLVNELLPKIGAYRCQAAHKWSEIFISDDLEAFSREGRGGKHSESFYDAFPELEIEARAFAVDGCSGKSADFSASHLAQFIDRRYYEVTQTIKINDQLIRSEKSCRLDLRRWGAKFEANSQRPYFEGHERPEVVEHREQFTSYFLNRVGHYYTVSDGDQPFWKLPSPNLKPCVLICMF